MTKEMTWMSDQQLKQQIKEMIVERLFLDADPQQMADDENLMENYEIDSVNLFEIVVGLEEQFDISFEDEDFSVDLFATVNSLAEYVETKRS
jgi:acyl carrier protein